MKKRTLAGLALLCGALASSAVLGQPYVGPEATSQAVAKAGGSAIVRDGAGFALASSENGRVVVTQLDASLQTMPDRPPLQLPIFHAGAEAGQPALATNGRTVLVMWPEAVPGGLTINVYTLLVAEAGALRESTVRLVNFTGTPFDARYVAGRYLLAGDLLYAIGDDGVVQPLQPLDRGVARRIAGNGAVAVAQYSAPSYSNCIPPPFGLIAPALCTVTESITFRSLPFTTTMTFTHSSSDPSPLRGSPLLATIGDHFLGLWTTTEGAHVVAFSTERELVRWDVAGVTADDAIAAGSGDALLVWSSNGTIRGVTLRDDGSQGAAFVIGAGEHPKLFATGAAEFVVTYETGDGAATQAVGRRIIRLAPVRGRAVR